MKNFLTLMVTYIFLGIIIFSCTNQKTNPTFKLGKPLPISIHFIVTPNADSIKLYKIGTCIISTKEGYEDTEKPIYAYGYFIGFNISYRWSKLTTINYDTLGNSITNYVTEEKNNKSLKKEDFWVENSHILKISDSNGVVYNEKKYEVKNNIGNLIYDSTWVDDKAVNELKKGYEKVNKEYNLNLSASKTHVIKYDYNNNSIIIKNDGIVVEKINHYKDFKGNIIKSESITNADTTKCYKKYNDKNQLIEEFCEKNDEYNFVLIYNYSYDKNGFVINENIYEIDKKDLSQYIKNGSAKSKKITEQATKYEYIKRLE